jgi:hypothetical protein
MDDKSIHGEKESSMIGKFRLTAVVIVGLMAGAARADSITLNGFPLNGSTGGDGGSHTISIDGVTCRLRNSTQGPRQGCNYVITGGIEAEGRGEMNVSPKPGEENRCSLTCEEPATD